MRSIGITGGVGGGKTALLAYLQERKDCRVLIADQIAHELEEPGMPCYNELVQLLGEEILDSATGRIHKNNLAKCIFGREDILQKVNAILHPAVKERILQEISFEQQKGTKIVFLEAALLLEDGYDKILDEIWYVYADEAVRRKRLKQNRGYSEEKIENIFRAQLSEEEYRSKCQRVIENNGELSEAIEKLEQLIGEGL